MKITSHVSQILQSNSYIVTDEQAGEFWVIDPACDMGNVLQGLRSDGLILTTIINTHGHFDHISGNRLCREMWPEADLVIHRDDASYLLDPKLNLSAEFGLVSLAPETATRLVDDGDILKLGDSAWQVLHTPGHTPGSMCLVGELGIFTGDTLFCVGVGRTDFPGGSESQLAQSLGRLADVSRSHPKSGDVRIYPGHGSGCSLRFALSSLGVDG